MLLKDCFFPANAFRMEDNGDSLITDVSKVHDGVGNGARKKRTLEFVVFSLMICSSFSLWLWFLRG